MAAVISLDTQTFLGHNQETYQDLRLAFQLNLRRQLLLAVCDDVSLQTQLARKLEIDLNPYGAATATPAAERVERSPIVTLQLDPESPDPVRQVLLWLKQHRLLKASAQTIPAFQILGLEQLTRQSPTLQNRFLASLIHVDALITRLDCRLLIWVPRPWLGKIQQAVPSFWRSRSGLFEFAGDPTPTSPSPISFEIFPKTVPASQDASSRTPAAAVELPSLGKTPAQQPTSRQTQQETPSASGPNPNLWTMLREDLAAFEHGSEATAAASVGKHGVTKFTTPASSAKNSNAKHKPTSNIAPNPRQAQPKQVAKASPPKAPPPAADSRQRPWTADANQGSGQVVEPVTNLMQAYPPATNFTVVTDALFPMVVLPPSEDSQTPSRRVVREVAHPGLETRNGASPKPIIPVPTKTAEAETTKPSPPVPAGLPPALTQDDELVRLWQYAQTLEAQQAGPLTLSRAYLGIAQISRDRIEAGTTAQTVLDFAISAYDKALPGLLEGDENWCDALNDLASLYWLCSQRQSDPSANAQWLGLSVEAYEKALQGAKDSASGETIVRIGSNLGTVYSLLANLTEPLANLRQSHTAYELALQYAPADALPLEYANLQNSLGAVHWRLAQLEQPQHHLHQAVLAYSAALQYRPPQAEPLEYAMIQNNLGIAYWSLAQHEHPRLLLEKAIEAYQAALQYRTLEQSPGGYAATNNNLGTAYWDLAQQHSRHPEQRIPCLRQAVVAYEHALNAAETALKVSPGTPLGFDVWATFHSAGVVHDQLAQGLPVDQHDRRKRHLEQALQHYLMAYQGWQDNPQQLEVLAAAMVYNIHLSFEILGLPGQQAVLSRVPAELLPQILGQL